MDNQSLCENCRKRLGKLFTFYYGKQLSEQSFPNLNNLNETTTIKTYRIGGKQQVVVCRVCIARNIIMTIVLSLVLAAILGGVGYFVLSAAPKISSNELASIVRGVGAIILLCGLAPLGLMIMAFSEPGENTAINLRSHSLRQMGYDAFWTTKDYQRLESRQLAK